MEGVEWEGLFTSQYVPALEGPALVPGRAPGAEEKKQKKGKGKEGEMQTAAPAALPLAPKGSVHQQQCQAAADAARAGNEVPGPMPWTILKRSEMAEREHKERKKAEERWEERAKKVAERV